MNMDDVVAMLLSCRRKGCRIKPFYLDQTYSVRARQS
jgi:hypothetical protein